jgi:hypothetical protein
MNDDWRLRVEFREAGNSRALSERLNAAEIEHDLERSFADRVIVSVDGPQLFCYAGTREQAERALQLIRRVSAEHGWQYDSELKHWHPSAEAWEDPDVPLPETDSEQLAEHAERIARERAEAVAQGFPEWEVRVTCSGHRQARELADRLREGGVPSVVHRWRYLLVGAPDEDSASELAARIRSLVPSDCPVTVEGTARAVEQAQPPNPFALMGGLGG